MDNGTCSFGGPHTVPVNIAREALTWLGANRAIQPASTEPVS
jgi:hypothetical protein